MNHDTDENTDEDDGPFEPYDSDPDYPKPSCCTLGAKYIRARYENLYCQSDVEFDAVLATVPNWALILSVPIDGFPESRTTRMVAINACPWCTAPLPGLRRKSEAPTTMRITDGGYYCGTCEERLMGCQCRVPEVLWEVMP